MTRITRKNLERMAENCNRQLPHVGWKYAIEYAYGRPRLVLVDEKICGREVSPRLQPRLLANWIWAYLAGADELRRIIAKP
jgi:hypothetical protein